MISYEDLQRLDGDNADELRALIDRRQELSDLPLSRGRVTAFEALYREAERLGRVSQRSGSMGGIVDSCRVLLCSMTLPGPGSSR